MIIALIPAYNCEKTIADVIKDAKKLCDSIIVYSDGSTDSTGDIAKALGADILSSKTKKGKGYALKQLFREASLHFDEDDVFVTLDGDGQHITNYIPDLVQPLYNGAYDIVIGTRLNQPPFRRIACKFLNIVGSYNVDSQSGIRAYSWRAIRRLEIKEEGFAVDQQLLDDSLSKNLRIKTVDVHTHYDKYSHAKNQVSHFIELCNYLLFRRRQFYNKRSH